MMKINFKNLKINLNTFDFKKILIIFLSILGTLILAGAIIVGVISFNGDSTASNNNVIELTENTITLMTDEQQNHLLKDVEKLLKRQGIKIKRSQILSGEGAGTKLQYVTSSSFGKIEEVCNNSSLENEIKTLSVFNQNTNPTPVLTAHARQYAPYFEHIWRAAVAIGVFIVVWFIYLAIRYRLAMSITAIIMLILDGLAMLSVVALCRIPVGISLMGSLAVTLLFSMLCSTFLFVSMYKNFRKLDWQSKTLRNATIETAEQNRTILLIFAAIIGILLGGITIIAGFFIRVAADLFGFALSTFLGLAITCTNTIFLTPILFYSIQQSFDSIKIKKGKQIYLAGKDLTLQKEKRID